ncbi:MAG: hypothetical protein RIE08_05495 [Acidimicrobiales bacterium]
MREVAAVGILFAVVIVLLIVVPLAGVDSCKAENDVDVDESSEDVLIRVPVRKEECDVGNSASVVLGAPLGERDVVDAFTGEVEPVADS